MRQFHVLNLGAGVQSSALYLLAREGRIPCDVAIFADTGEEPAAVYQHLGQLISMEGPCTKEYKVEIVERAIRRELLGLKPRQRIPTDVTVHQYFGISTDEAGRAERGRKRFAGVRHTVPVYPLIDIGWSRSDCVAYLRDRLPYEVPKSSCVFCPFRTNQSWRNLQHSDPAGWQRAVEIDTALRADGSIVTRGFRQKLYLHRSCVPLAEIDFAALAPNTLDPLTTGECHGVCGV
ncbi:MAG: hypothetical protein LC104_06050 [Bacteroidales bacterium]|nr:hypothetical protein [Bacteroidales bacterium]